MGEDVTSLLMDLVGIPSVSHMTNRAVVEYAMARLDPEHWITQLHSYQDPAGVLKHNLVALTRNAKGERAELAFVCHTDTVPFDAAWKEAVHPQFVDGRVYGRGSCDVKGFLACALAAFEQVDFAALGKPMALILTADEEVGCVGAKHLAARGAFSTRYMVIGEPTGLRPVCAGKGYGLATITVRGKEAHSAFPSAGRSAIYDAARVIAGLETMALEWQTREGVLDRRFDPPYTTLNIGVIEGGTAKNIVAGECRLTVEWRPIPGSPIEGTDEIRKLLARLAQATPGLDAELTVLRNDPPFAPSESQKLGDLLAQLARRAPTTISFGSEAAHLRTRAEEIIVFGPGDMTVAHKTGEHIAVSELEECTRCLKELVEEQC